MIIRFSIENRIDNKIFCINGIDNKNFYTNSYFSIEKRIDNKLYQKFLYGICVSE